MIADLTVTDPEGFEEYRRKVPATAERYGGRYLVRGGKVDALEREWGPRLAVIALASTEQARAARTNLIVVDGV